MNQDGNKSKLTSSVNDLEQIVLELRRRTLLAELTRDDLQNNFCLRLSIKKKEGYCFIAVKDIFYIEAQQDNVRVYSSVDEPHLMNTNLKNIESLLSSFHFLRVHRSYLVNLTKVKRVISTNGLQLLLEDKTLINVSRSFKKQVVKYIQEHRF